MAKVLKQGGDGAKLPPSVRFIGVLSVISRRQILNGIMDYDKKFEPYIRRGTDLFKQGYNCTQSVVLAFAPYYQLPEPLVARLVSGLGAGMGRMREQCGTATGIFILSGLETASAEPSRESKARSYAAVQELARRFREEAGSLVCRELLKGHVKEIQTTPMPDERTDDYYKRRPCVGMVEMALRIYASWLTELTCAP